MIHTAEVNVLVAELHVVEQRLTHALRLTDAFVGYEGDTIKHVLGDAVEILKRALSVAEKLNDSAS